MAGCARPVRIPAKSSLATATAFSIFSSASRRVSSITAAPVRCDPAASRLLDNSDGREARSDAPRAEDHNRALFHVADGGARNVGTGAPRRHDGALAPGLHGG